MNIYLKEMRAAVADKKHTENVATTTYNFNMSYVQNEKTMGYANAPYWADFMMAPSGDLAAQSTYFQGLAATRYDFEISMATVWETYRKGQADDVYNNAELRAQHEFFNISDTETTDHDTRVAIATFVSVYDDMMTSIITTEANSSANSSSQYNTQVLQALLAMFQANAQHDLDYGTEVSEADRDEQVNKTTTKSAKTVTTYQNHQSRVAEFATSQASPWGQLQLDLANAALSFQNLFKAALDTFTTNSEDRTLSFLGDYLQEIKAATVGDASSGTSYVQNVLGSLMTFISSTNSAGQTQLTNKIAALKAFQIALSLVYKNWNVRIAEIERDKKISDADALRDFLHGEALVLKNVEPTLAYARKNLAIAQAKFTFNQITSAEMATAQADYASIVASTNAQVASLREPLLLAQRTAEGEAIRVKTVETAKAEQTRVTDSSTHYLTWVNAAGSADIAAAGSLKTSGDTFVTAEASEATTANDSTLEANKTFISNVAEDSADFSSDLTGIANAFYSNEAGISGGLIYSKSDARASYESTLAENHRLRKESAHGTGQNALTSLQFAVATADAAKYVTRRNALQTRTLVAKNDRIQLTTLLNTAEQNVVDQLNTAELTFTNGSIQASTSMDKQSGAAASTLGKEAAKASINRSKDDTGAVVTASISVANAEVAHALRVQTASVTLAEATGAALKQKHIDQYTQAAIAVAETAIAQATAIFKASEKTSNITRAGDVGDAAIAAANTTGQNLITQITSQNTAMTTYTTTTNSLESTFTATINGLTVPYTQGTSAAIIAVDNATANAMRTILASTGVADVNWITAFANADATRTGAQAAAQAGWVTSSVQSGGSVLLWNCGDVTSSNASGSWASQYAPARTAMITTTALVDAGRQITAWLDRTLRDNDQADADVQYIQAIAAPGTQLAVAIVQHENQHTTANTSTLNNLRTDQSTSDANVQNTSAAIEKSSAVDSATAWKAYQVALASLDEGAATTTVDKAYQDALAQVTRNSRVAYANLIYTEGIAQMGAMGDTITEFGQAGKIHVTNVAVDEKNHTDIVSPIIGARILLYTEADNDLSKAITTADNVWRNNTAQAWGAHTAGDLVARGNVRRSLANTSNLLADASQASIEELKAQWWQNEIPNYLQWSVDIGGIETTYTNSTTANKLLRTTGLKNGGIAYASTVGTAIKDYETTTATARQQYLSTLINIGETAGEAAMRADRDKKISIADADLQKQLTGNESAHATAVSNANNAHSTATANAGATRKSAELAALTQLNSTLAQASKDKEAAIAGAERTYDQTVASLDAQYGSESSNGDTGVEGATRRIALKSRDAQYYAARDTSWANTLSGSTTLGTSPWTVKAITAANAQAVYSTSRANGYAAHDAAMFDAIEDWQLSSRESLTDLLLTNGQSRETFNLATSNVYANWQNGVGNLMGNRPAGTGWGVGENGGNNQVGNPLASGWFGGILLGGDETDETESGKKQQDGLPPLPTPQVQIVKPIWADLDAKFEDQPDAFDIDLFKQHLHRYDTYSAMAFDETNSSIVFGYSYSILEYFWGLGEVDSAQSGNGWNIHIPSEFLETDDEEGAAKKVAEYFRGSGTKLWQIRNGIAIRELDPEFTENGGRAREAIAFQRAGETVEIGANAYLGILGVFNDGADIVLVVNDVYEGNYYSLIAILPFVSRGAIKIVDSAGVEIKVSGEFAEKLAKAPTAEAAQKLLKNAPEGAVTVGVRGFGCFVADTKVLVVPNQEVLGVINSTPIKEVVNLKTKSTVEQCISISDVRLGDRVLATNPISDERFYDPVNDGVDGWKIISLVVHHATGEIVDVELLRSPEWVERNGIYEGGYINLRLTEIDVDAVARVEAVTDAHSIMDGHGSVVIGRFVTRAGFKTLKC
jgi:hypothetical protein